MFLTKGVGRHKERLTSFEMALRDAGIAAYNLVRVSSIFPPGCRLVSRPRGLKKLKPGTVVFCVMAETSTNEPNRLIAASVGVAIPKDPREHGYLSEHHSGRIVNTGNVTQAAIGDKEGRWTTVVAAAILLSENQAGGA